MRAGKSNARSMSGRKSIISPLEQSIVRGRLETEESKSPARKALWARVPDMSFFFFFFLSFLGPLPKHMDVPRLGVELEL